MKERFAHVVKILWSKINEPIELIFLDFFEHILVVEWAIEFRFSLSTCDSRPLLCLDERLNEIILGSTVEPAKRFKFLCKENFDFVFYLWYLQLIFKVLKRIHKYRAFNWAKLIYHWRRRRDKLWGVWQILGSTNLWRSDTHYQWHAFTGHLVIVYCIDSTILVQNCCVNGLIHILILISIW